MFRIMSRRALDELCRFLEREPSITGLVSVIGLRTTKDEYVARIFLEVKRRPLYLVEEEIGELGKVPVQGCDTAAAT
jgi:hypothetical protein